MTTSGGKTSYLDQRNHPANLMSDSSIPLRPNACSFIRDEETQQDPGESLARQGQMLPRWSLLCCPMVSLVSISPTAGADPTEDRRLYPTLEAHFLGLTSRVSFAVAAFASLTVWLARRIT
jgi:hypothetical protein